MKATIKLDDSRFRQAMRDYARYSRKSGESLLRAQARLFVRDVVRITPPNQGRMSKQKGDAAVRVDLSRILKPSRRANAEDAASVHARMRRRNGRVDRRYNPVPARNVAAYRRQVLANVGILASGWNAAAVALGLNLPAWITRHGTKYGSIKVQFSWVRLVITISNMVRFAGAVRGMERRLQSALDRRARALRKQVAHYLKRDARRAGFKK